MRVVEETSGNGDENLINKEKEKKLRGYQSWKKNIS
jgi:hypothetical protein